MPSLQQQFGDIDIYLFDQLLRARIRSGMRILDAGCGAGRNLTYLLREGFDVYAVDQDPSSVAQVRTLVRNASVHAIEKLPFESGFFDFIISSAVLHFAQDDKHFLAMVYEMWRVLNRGGILFCRLASSIGIEKKVKCIAGRTFLLPDGSHRYLVDAALLEKIAQDLQADLMDPIKTTVVHNQRSMTTWVLQKREPSLRS
jgi:tellurite methyltransferase